MNGNGLNFMFSLIVKLGTVKCQHSAGSREVHTGVALSCPSDNCWKLLGFQDLISPPNFRKDHFQNAQNETPALKITRLRAIQKKK